MKKKLILTGLFFIVLIMLTPIFSDLRLHRAIFFNDYPTVKIGNYTYKGNQEIVSAVAIGKKYARITQRNNVISYLEKDEPYKNLGYIYSIQDENPTEVIAIDINGVYYKAKISNR